MSSLHGSTLAVMGVPPHDGTPFRFTSNGKGDCPFPHARVFNSIAEPISVVVKDRPFSVGFKITHLPSIVCEDTVELTTGQVLLELEVCIDGSTWDPLNNEMLKRAPAKALTKDDILKHAGKKRRLTVPVQTEPQPDPPFSAETPVLSGHPM